MHYRHCSVVILVLSIAAGCSNGGRVKVHGKVSLDGTPVESGAVTFRPNDGQGQTTGAVIKHGEFAADVAPGTMRVEITAAKVVGKRRRYNTPDSPLVEVVTQLIPAEYNSRSKLTRVIAPAQPEINFELTTRKR